MSVFIQKYKDYTKIQGPRGGGSQAGLNCNHTDYVFNRYLYGFASSQIFNLLKFSVEARPTPPPKQKGHTAFKKKAIQISNHRSQTCPLF